MTSVSRRLDGPLVGSFDQDVTPPVGIRTLAGAGTRALKPVSTEDDVVRGYDCVVHGSDAYFSWHNRGRQPVVVDLSQDEGHADDPRFRRNVAGVDNTSATDAPVAPRFRALQTHALIVVLKHPCLRRNSIRTPKSPPQVPATPAQMTGLEPLVSAIPVIGNHRDAEQREFFG